MPEGVHEDPYRILFSETRCLVEDDGTKRTRWRQARQVLTVKAEGLGFGAFPFESNAKVKVSKAWHVPPGEKAERGQGPPVDLAISDHFLTDQKARFVGFVDLKRGSLVFFEFEGAEEPYALGWIHDFYEGAPSAISRFELETPAGWSVRSAWIRGQGPEPTESGNVRVWEMRDVASLDREPLGDPPSDRVAGLAINIAPSPGTAIKPAVVHDWPAFSSWFETLARGSDGVTPEIDAAAKKALAPTGGKDFYDKVRAASLFVRDGVRYLDIEIGIGGYQPHAASETLANLYGDCKDKATLLRALLAAEGVASYGVAVHATARDTVASDVPALDSFNHMINAVPIPPDASLPDFASGAVADGGDLGKLLIVDTTHHSVSIGSLPDFLSGKRALVLAGSRGRLVTLPSGDPRLHRIERRIRMDLTPERSLAVSMVSRFFGDPASHVRLHARRSATERRKNVEARVRHVWTDAEVEEYTTDLETADGAAIETVGFKVPAARAVAGHTRVELFPGAGDELPRTSLGKRKTSVVYDVPMTIRYETTLVGVPEAAVTPDAQEVKGDGWGVTTSFTREGGELRAVWELTLSRTRFAPEEFPQLKKLWAAANATSDAAIRLAP